MSSAVCEEVICPVRVCVCDGSPLLQRVRDVCVEFSHPDLLEFYTQMERIQTQLDSLTPVSLFVTLVFRSSVSGVLEISFIIIIIIIIISSSHSQQEEEECVDQQVSFL
ncbi:hypothetical protein F2P79_023374 [Pimephales promelas]|nr:hypothetical protein F2P79_023374 [Pimephales promelas]